MSFAKLFQRIKDGLEQPQRPAETHHQPLHLATAAVLLEIAFADGEFTPSEDGDVAGYLQKVFSLDEDSARELMRAGDEIRTRTIDHFELTNYIRRHTALEDRLQMVRTMWRIVYADGRLSDYENYLVRKISDLLGVEHRLMIDAKVAVLGELGKSEA